MRDLEPGPAGEDRRLRESARALFSPERLAAWQAEWAPWWAEGFAALPRECDLVKALAEPVCLRIAALVGGIGEANAARLSPVAYKLFDAEADPAGASQAAVALMGTVQDPLLVQAFAALCHTLAAFLGNAWLALLDHPEELARLAATPDLMTDAIEELLRFAGPSAAVFRRDAGGGRVMLKLAEANRDPEVFFEPDRLRLDRRPGPAHLAFGAGPHACVGAALIRLAAQPAIAGFAARFHGRGVTFQAEPGSSLTLRFLRSLWIRSRTGGS